MRKTLLLILFLSSWVSTLSGQAYRGGYDDLFLGRFPSPRGEAMSGSMVAVSDGLYSVYSNPALIMDTPQYSLALSTSQKYYFFEKARYLFISAGFSIGKKIKLAFSRYQMDINESIQIWTGSSYYSYDWIRSINQLTLALKANSSFYIGTNLAFFDQNLYNPDIGKDEHQQTFYADVGVLYKQQLKDNRLLSFGLNIKNITSSKEKILVATQKDPLPVIMYLGTAFQQQFLMMSNSHSFPFTATLSITYQDVLNYKFKSGIRTGIEFELAELCNLQAGYYYVKLDDGGYQANKDHISGVTLGMGITIPVYKFSSGLPLDLQINVSNTHQPSGSNDFSFDRTWVLGIRIAKR